MSCIRNEQLNPLKHNNHNKTNYKNFMGNCVDSS